MALVPGPRRARGALAALIIVALGTTLLPSGASANPAAAPTPTVASVTAKLDSLGRQTERLAEQYNKARLGVAAAQRAATGSRRAAATAASRYQAAHTRFVQVLTAQYENGSASAAGALLNSSGSNYLDRLSTLDLITRQQSDVVTYLGRAKTSQTAARDTEAAALRAAEAQRRVVREQRDAAAAQTKKFETLLATLTVAQRAAYATRMSVPLAAVQRTGSPSTPAQQAGHHATRMSVPRAAVRRTGSPSTPAQQAGRFGPAGNAAVRRAIDFALAQVGKPYVFGAAGPGSFDCSGLTMAAWRAGGVSLPHLAASQFNYGTHVPASQLQPGDLVFLYNPIGHVSMYIGRGMLVSAPQPGENVKVVPFSYYASDFVGATRLV